MEMAIMQDPDNSEKNSMISIALLNSILIFFLCLVGSIFFSEETKLEVFIIAFSSFLISLQNMAVSIANLNERYWVLSISRLIFPIFFLLIVWLTKNINLSFPLATSHMFASFLVVLFLLKTSSYNLRIKYSNKKLSVIKKYVNYVKFDLPSGLLNASALLLPVYLIGILFGEESSGLYFLAFKLVLSPIGAITMAVGYVYRREAVKEYSENNTFIKTTQNVFLFLLSLSMLMLLTYYFVGPLIFNLFFKEDWSAALPIISILMPMFAIKLVASPLSFSFYIVDKLKLDLYGQLFFIIASVLAIYGGYLLNDFISSVYFIAISSGFVYFVYTVKSIQFSKGKVE
jgi:O-antigen/teichoic acid export membrane protein